MFRSLIIYLFKVHGYSLKDEVRLRLALINYLFYFLVNKLKGGSLGFYVPGKDPLTIKTWDGYVFVVMSKTPHLTHATLTMEQYELKKWFLPHAKGVVVDVGASIGGYTVRACRQADLIVALEPEKETFELLKKNISINCPKDKVILLRKAVGGEKGKLLLRVPVKGELTDTGVASLTKFISPWRGWKDYKLEEVDIDALDNIMASLGIDRIDFLKIDIEGAEAIAFEGMKNVLKNTKYLMIEIHPENIWLVNEFVNMGFKLIDKRGMNYFFSQSRN